MRIPIGPGRRRDMQDVLRSLGAVLDTVHARAVMIRETDDGLILRARVAPSAEDRLEGRWTPLERHLSAPDLARHQREALQRRGTGHVAGPHERSLRMIGRHIDEDRLRGITLIQHHERDSWLLWHEDTERARPALLVLIGDELRVADEQAAEARLALEHEPGGVPGHIALQG